MTDSSEMPDPPWPPAGRPLSIGIIGAGVMGRGIAEACASHGLDTVLLDVDEGVGHEALTEISKRLRAAALMGGPGANKPAEVLARIRFTTSYAALARCGLVIENVTENLETKRRVYEQIAPHLSDDAILAANTSTFPIGELAQFASDKTRLIGLHFMNPASTKTYVEVIPSKHTSRETIDRALSCLARIGRSGIVVNDSPGFVSNRILMMVVNEAANLVETGVATTETVDQIFVGCFGHAMGPLATADLIGLDTIVLSLESLKDRLHDPRFEPSVLLKRLVAENRLGRKTNGGFYAY